MNRTWKRGFDAARAASQNSIAPRRARKVGAALFSGSILLTLAHNSYNQSHPAAGKYGTKLANVHSEHRALLRRRHYDIRNNLVLYVYRELADGTAACSRPCNNCIGLLIEAGVRLVRFVNLKGEWEELKLT